MSASSALHGAVSTLLSNTFISLPLPKATPELAKKTIIVTGSNVGLGLESSRHFLRLGVGKLIMGVRNLEKGEKARKELLQSTKRAADTVEVWPIDMDDYSSVASFAARANKLQRLDAVLANAGIMTQTFAISEDNEKTITVNVVSTFLLCLLLLPKLRAAPDGPGIFTIPNSALHYMASTKELDPLCAKDSKTDMFTRLNDPDKAEMAGRYPLSKLMVLYATRELAARMATSGKPAVVINTPNPSYCKSELMRDMKQGALERALEIMLARSTEVGSRTLVHAVLAGPESQGQYLTNCHVQTPSSLVTNAAGRQIQKHFFEALLQKLEAIHPGVSASI